MSLDMCRLPTQNNETNVFIVYNQRGQPHVRHSRNFPFYNEALSSARSEWTSSPLLHSVITLQITNVQDKIHVDPMAHMTAVEGYAKPVTICTWYSTGPKGRRLSRDSNTTRAARPSNTLPRFIPVANLKIYYKTIFTLINFLTYK